MIDITLQNFETALIAGSVEQPVLLDIWAPWCGPCRTLGPMLEALEEAYAGRFTLAKLNADEVPEIATQLSQAFGVRSIPFCVMFMGGQPVDGFVGALPEAQIRAFLDKHLPSADELVAAQDVEEAEALLAQGDTDTALARLADALAADPKNEAARFDLVKALIERDALEEAQAAFEPVAALATDKITPHARFAALGLWLSATQAARTADTAALQAAIGANKRDFDARYALAQTHAARGDFPAAMDELLEIVMRDKAWNNQAARKLYVALLEVLTKPVVKPAAAKEAASKLQLTGHAVAAPSDPVIELYRRKLSMALF